eukprot:649914-Lingulodinium_polyedra.AAC.1
MATALGTGMCLANAGLGPWAAGERWPGAVEAGPSWPCCAPGGARLSVAQNRLGQEGGATDAGGG